MSVFSRTLALAVLLTVLLLFLCVYLYLALASWFVADDFVFLREYRRSVQLDQILSFVNFGRFLSRNLYWFLMQQTFGATALPYYLINLIIVLSSACFIYAFCLKVSGRRDFSLVAASLYFVSGSVLWSYSWISNVQHLLAHLLVFATLWLWVKVLESGVSHVFPVVVFLFGIGLFANVLYGFVLAPLTLLTVTRRGPTRRARLYLVLFVELMLFAVFIARIPLEKDGPYQTRLSLAILEKNLGYYTDLSPLPFGTWITVTAVVALSLLFSMKREWIGLTLVAAAVAFYSPFAFMVFQRAPTYIALSAFFILAGTAYGLAILTRERARLFVVTAGILIGFVAGRAVDTIAPVITQPFGAPEKTFLAKLGATDVGEFRIVCFWSGDVDVNTTGVAAWDIPRFWWWLGFGAAFDVLTYPDGHQRIHRYKTEPECEAARVAMVKVQLVGRDYAFTIGTRERVPPYTFGADIGFQGGGNANRYQVGGWRDPETWGCWTEGKRASLRMRIEDVGAPAVVLEATVMSIDEGEGRQTRADVLVNGERVAQWTFTGRGITTERAAIATELLRPDGELEITFQIADPDSSAQLGLATDRRLGFRSVRLQPVR